MEEDLKVPPTSSEEDCPTTPPLPENSPRASEKKKAKHGHTSIMGPGATLVCWYCGSTYDYNRALPAPLYIGSAILEAFRKEHKHCEKSPAGLEAWCELHLTWGNWMEAHPKEREEWETDCKRAWVKRTRKEWEELYAERYGAFRGHQTDSDKPGGPA